MWEPNAAFGHVQNQSVGYLFPMGPFFALGHAIGLPMWIVQRLWIALVLVAALWGALKVAEALDVGSPTTRLIGALAYALSPAMTSLLGYETGGQVPVALLPWIVLPLIGGAVAGSTRRSAARSGIAVAAMGAVNATSTIAVLPLPVLFLLTRKRSARRGSLMRWWVLSVGLACLWWVVPLVLQSRYGLNFVPYTENASTTAATTSAFEVVRGTGHWLSYLFVNGAWLRGAWAIVSAPLAIVATAALAAGGLYGLARRDMPERTFLVLAVALGALAIGIAYSGPAGGPFAGTARTILDGPLSALRNVSKLEPVLRLPLALGLAHALAQLRLRGVERGLVTALALAVVAAGAIPLVQNELLPAGSFRRIPAYWTDAAHWLGDHANGGRTLVLPAEPFGEYRWGRPLDEPLQALATTPWAERNLIPLGTPELTRLLDGIDQRVDSAATSPGLTSALARAGVKYVLVRNDVDPFRSSAPSPGQIRRSLTDGAGLRPIASFGPTLGSRITSDRLAPDLAAAARPVRAIDIYAVPDAVARAATYPVTGVQTLAGGPESVLQLADRPNAKDTPVVLPGQEATSAIAGGETVAGDEFRRRDVSFGAIRDNASYALTSDEPAPGSDHAPRDWPAPTAGRTDMQLTGATRVTASSYASLFARLPERQPWAAFDGDPSTAWVSGSLVGSAGEWVQVDLPRAVDPGSVTLQLLKDHPWRPYATAVTLSTDAGHVTRKLRATENAQRLALPHGRTKRIRVTLARVTGGFGSVGAGLREVAIPGVEPDRAAVVPGARTDPAPSVSMLDRLRNDPFDIGRADEEGRIDRVVNVASGATAMAGTVTGRPGPALDALIAKYMTTPLAVVPSSTWNGLPSFSARNAFDGRPDTAWVASPDDRSPSLQLSWAGQRHVDSLEIHPAPGPTLTPTHVQLLSPAGKRDFDVADAPVPFEPLTTDQVTVVITDSTPTAAAKRGQGLVAAPAVGVSELRVGGLEALGAAAPDPATPVQAPCGSGPSIAVDGHPVPTAVSGQLGDVLALRPLQLSACGAAVPAGVHHVTTPTDGPWNVDSLTIGSPSAPQTAPPRPIRIARWGSEARVVDIEPGATSVVATTENFNTGWRADLHGVRLKPVRLDGWRQGWVVPAGNGGRIELSFAPDRTYRLGLLFGAFAVAVLLALAFVRRRPGPDLQPTRRWTLSSRATVAVAVGTAILLAGWAAVLVVPVALLCPRRGRPVLAGGSFALAGVIAFVQPGRLPGSGSGAFGSPVQVLSVLAVVAMVLALGGGGGEAEEKDVRPEPVPD